MPYRKKTNVALWVLQVLLGLFFVLASGAPKLLMPAEALPMPISIAQPLLWFIGVAEVAGGFGLILPGLFRIHTGLTPLAAAGLVIVTVGATVYNLAAGQPGSAVFAVVVGLLCAFIAYGRWKMTPLRDSSRPPSALKSAA